MKIERINTKSIIGKSGISDMDFAANPYLGCEHQCRYCYATFMKRFSKHPSVPWGEYVGIKDWETIKNPQKYAGKSVMLSSVTDCYQPLEAKYKRTRRLLEQLQGIDIKLFIVTKSSLVTRDIDLISTFPNAQVAISLNSMNQKFLNRVDNASSAEERLNALKTLHKAGIATTCFIAPTFPKLSNVKKVILTAYKYSTKIWIEKLVVYPSNRKYIFDMVKHHYPQYYDLYDQIYNQKDNKYWIKLEQSIQRLKIKHKEIPDVWLF